MTTASIAGKDINVDGEGFMTQPDQWDREVATAISGQVGIELTPEHWKLVDFAREDFGVKHQSPGLRRISKLTRTGMKDIYRLFPKGPGKLIARIAGLPKPKSCL